MSTRRFTDLAAWIVTGASGCAWGLGLARVLALELHAVFLYGATGAMLCAALCAALAVALSLRRQQRTPWQTAFQLIPLLLPLVDVFGGGFHAWRGPVLLAGSLVLTVLFVTETVVTRHAGLLIAVALPLLVYLFDLSPYVGRADTFEFQVIAPRLGIAHPSGYPLYILVGKLFSLLPFGSVAWRVNLSSAVCAALASGALFLALTEKNRRTGESANRRISELQITNYEFSSGNPQSTIHNPQSEVLALLVALTLAFSPTLWSRAVEAEVYALNALLVAMGLWLAVSWTSGRLATKGALPAMGLLTGVAMASHVTLGALFLLALPLMMTARPRPTFRTLLSSAALGLAGLALYLYIPLRWPAVTGEMMAPGQFLRFVTNADSGGALRPLAFVHDPARWGLVFRLLRMQVGWAGLSLGLWGLARLFRRHWALALGSLLAFLAWVWFNLSFYVADPDYSAFLIPAHAILLFWIGMGVTGCRLQAEGHVLRFAVYVCITALALFPLNRLWITGPALDTTSMGREDEAWARYALRHPLADGAAILADSEKFPPLYYLQQVEGLRPDLELVTLFNEAQYREALEQRLNAGQRVYLARYLPGMDAFGVGAAGPLVEVRPPVTDVTSPAVARFGAALALHSHRLEPDPEGRAMHHLVLEWRAVDAPGDDLTVGLRLTDETGSVAWESTPARPVAGYTTTQAWQAGQRVEDYHAVRWPLWLAPGNYHLEIGVFPRFSPKGLPVDGGPETWLWLEDITITATVDDTGALPRQYNALFDDVAWLTGADFPAEASAGGTLTVDLVWESGGEPLPPAPDILWIDQNGAVQSATTAPMEAHRTGAFVARHTLIAPLEPGGYTLAVGRHTRGIDAARCHWLGQLRSYCVLGDVQVNPSTAGLANFDNRIVLIDATFDAEAALAGGQLHVDLRWRGLRALDRDYTVFVQVVGPDGTLHGQVDSWPVQGARPTGGWQVGEEIEDSYRLYLKENAPAGEYRIIVGWYLLADMSRLNVIDATGTATGDFYTIGTFAIP